MLAHCKPCFKFASIFDYTIQTPYVHALRNSDTSKDDFHSCYTVMSVIGQSWGLERLHCPHTRADPVWCHHTSIENTRPSTSQAGDCAMRAPSGLHFQAESRPFRQETKASIALQLRGKLSLAMPIPWHAISRPWTRLSRKFDTDSKSAHPLFRRSGTPSLLYSHADIAIRPRVESLNL